MNNDDITRIPRAELLLKLRLSCPCQPAPLQGDVIGLLDSTGTQVVKYTYDAWGKPASKSGTMKNTLGTVQPFRYCGYVFDEETGMYYLRTRYYSPHTGRFLNIDQAQFTIVYDELFDYSLYTYCENSPINLVDSDGEFGVLAWLLIPPIGAAATVFIEAALTITAAFVTAVLIVEVAETANDVIVCAKAKNKSKTEADAQTEDNSKERSKYLPAKRKRYNTKKKQKKPRSGQDVERNPRIILTDMIRRIGHRTIIPMCRIWDQTQNPVILLHMIITSIQTKGESYARSGYRL